MPWHLVYGRICREIGCRPREAKKLKVSEAAMLWKFWAECPPADDLIAAYLGYSPKPSEERTSTFDEMLHFAIFAGGMKLG